MKIITKEKTDKLVASIAVHKKKPGPLMPSIQSAQKIFGCVPLVVQKIIAKELNENISKINGVVTFYSQFTLEPIGKNVVSVCMGTACYVKGSQTILDKYSKAFDLAVNQTSKDGEITLIATRCIGACGLAPVVTVGEEVYGNLTVQTSQKVIDELIGGTVND